MLHKLIGILLMIIGVFLLKYFPDIDKYQKSQMTLTGIFIGIILIVFGIALLIFGD